MPKYRIVVSPKGRKPSVHHVTARNKEDAERKATKLGAAKGTLRTSVTYAGPR